jgi:DNA-directed RNA polymerase specialized sigma24 family protein
MIHLPMGRPEAHVRTGEERTFRSSDVLPRGIDGYSAAMKRYPALSREQTEAALEALRSGQSLHDLWAHALFAPHLAQEERDLLNNPSVYHAPPVRSYRQLFADSPTIENLVAFGTFPTVLQWVKKFQTTYNGLPLELEEFMQDALYTIVPEAARRYEPAQGASFANYISTMLRWRLDNLATACIRERSTLPAGAQKEGLKATHDSRRQFIESLDAPHPSETENGDPGSFYDVVADERASLPGESLASGSAIRTLYAIAGISPKQAQVLQTSVIAGESQEYAASLCGIGARAIRTRRTEAVKKFRRLGKERVIAILNGDGDAPEKKK